MANPIERVAVIGAGTMGAAIAAHVANAGLPVTLLDIAPASLTPEEEAKGLSLDHPRVRDRIVEAGFARIAKLKPPSLMSAAARELVTLGNLEDDLERLADADWIVEAVVERLDVKRALLARIDGVRGAGSLVTTNTSGLPIASIVEGRSDDLRRSFFGTHFFNPPRYMKLLEVIAGEETAPAVIDRFTAFAAHRLGKGVVRAKDTPNFIGNRIMAVHGTFVIDHALANGYRVEEVDAVTGPLLGRPKTATFRLQDLVGIDIAAHVAENLYALVPDDPYRETLRGAAAERVIAGLVERGRLGNKTGAGFYRKSKDGASGKTVFEVLDPSTFEYRAPTEAAFPAVAAVGRIPDTGERLSALFAEEHRGDRGAQLAWAVTAQFLAYSAACAPEIAFDLASIDDAVRWGFSYEDGPFELWDRLGVAATAGRLEAAGYDVAPWVKSMLARGCTTFYRREDGRATGCYDWTAGAYVDLPVDPRSIRAADLHAAASEIAGNKSASLLDLGEGVLLLELHAKMNAIDDDIVAMMRQARERLDDDGWTGLVIGTDGPNFCVGANLMNVAGAIQAGAFDAIAGAIDALQRALAGLRAAPKPVVAAVHGMALGGGCEIALGVDRIVAAAESYIGLVEVGVGLLPAGGGLEEMVRRHITPAAADGDVLPAAQRVLETVGTAKVSGSAAEARELGFLGDADRVVMNRDHLLFEARREVLAMAAGGYLPPAATQLHAAGRDLLAALELGVWSLQQAGWASAHDARIAKHIAFVLAGGDGSAAQTADPGWFLRLEREAFVALCRRPETQDRIRHMLETGKPLRN